MKKDGIIMAPTKSRKPPNGEGMTRRGRKAETETSGRPNGKEKELCKTALTMALQKAYPNVARGSYTGDGIIVVGVSPCIGCVVSAGTIGERDIKTGLYFQQFNGSEVDGYVEKMLRTRGLDQYTISGECPLDFVMVSPDGKRYRTEILAWGNISSITERMKGSYKDATKITV